MERDIWEEREQKRDLRGERVKGSEERPTGAKWDQDQTQPSGERLRGERAEGWEERPPNAEQGERERERENKIVLKK